MPWVLVGSGGALLIASIATGLLAEDADEDFVAQCPELRDCDPRLESLQNRVETLGTVTDVLLVTGSVAVAGGIAWWLVVPRSEPSSGASGVRATPGLEIGVRGEF